MTWILSKHFSWKAAIYVLLQNAYWGENQIFLRNLDQSCYTNLLGNSMLQHEGQCLSWTVSYFKGNEGHTACPKCFSFYFWAYCHLIFSLPPLSAHLGEPIVFSLHKTLPLLASFSSASAPAKPSLWFCCVHAEGISIYLFIYLTESHWGFKLTNIFRVKPFPSDKTNGFQWKEFYFYSP